MKLGCLYYADSDNIGDDIQTYAQWKFLPRVDYWIDRESLNLFCPNENEKVALIMNAWFMYSPQNWPPSPYIFPLFVSVHFSKYHVQWLKLKNDTYSFAQDYLRANAPIGCREVSTLQTLQELGIDAYFSGCLTLTLQPFPNIEKQDYICLVDVSQDVADYVKNKGYPVRVMSHNQINAAKMTPEKRLEQAEEYLKIYQSARCVLTSRLHCALPCTGLGTPVLVLYSPEFEERFSGLKEFLHTTTEEELLQGKWDSFLETPSCHSGEHIQYANTLAQRCREFIENALKTEEPVELDYEYYKKTSALQRVVQKETYISEIRRLSEGYIEERKIIENLQKSSNAKEAENCRLQKKCDQLQKGYDRLCEENKHLQMKHHILLEEQNALQCRCDELKDYASRLRRLRTDALYLLGVKRKER